MAGGRKEEISIVGRIIEDDTPVCYLSGNGKKRFNGIIIRDMSHTALLAE
jgi:hypothetical protein